MSCEEFLEDPYKLPETENEGKCGHLSIFASLGTSRDTVFHSDRKTFPETHFENEKPNNSHTHKNKIKRIIIKRKKTPKFLYWFITIL